MKAEDITEALDDARFCLENAEQKIANLEVDRDAILAYAAFLQMELTLDADYRALSPLKAIDRVLKNSLITIVEASEAGWGSGEFATLMNCRDAVKELPG